MNIDKIKVLNNNYYTYQTNEFATIQIKHSLCFDNTKENYIKSYILANYMMKTNKIYKTRKEIRNRCKELYGLEFYIYPEIIGTKMFLSFNLKMVDPKIIEDNFFDDAINFYKDMILNPNFENDKLNIDVFKEVKKEFLDKQKNNIKNPSIMQERIFYKNLIPKSDINNYLITDIVEFENIISSINDIDIVSFYNYIINNYVCSYSFGNLSNKDNEKINNLFKFKPIKFDYKYSIKEEINEDIKEIVSKDTSQSYLYVVYDIKDYKKEKSYIYDTILNMLNLSSGLCFQVLRDKLGLVYSSYGRISYNRGFMFICAQIDKKNYHKSLEGIDEIFKKLHDKKIVEKLLTFSKERQNQLFYTNTEELKANINELENYIYKKDISKNQKINLINKLEVDDIINQVNNIEKRFVFFYKGDKDEK